MSLKPDSASADALRALHHARAIAEIAQADAVCPGFDAVAWRGDPIGEIVLLKGAPGPAEAAGGAAASGQDGEALDKALEALGWSPAHAFFGLTRPGPPPDEERCARRVRLLIEAVDPVMVVALDELAAADVAAAFGLPALKPGRVVEAGGRRILAVEPFEASLTDERAKRRVWKQLSVARPRGPVY